MVEYLVLNVNLPGKHVKSNVESIGNITSFRTYDIYFHYDVRGHSAGIMLPRSMRVALSIYFLRFSYRFFLFFSLWLFFFSFILRICLIFLFWPCLFTKTSRAFEKRHSQSRFSELNFSSIFYFRHLKASGVLPVCI